MREKVVIIGASITGFYAMNELVKKKFDGTITLIDGKDVLPNNPYPLSKEWMLDLEQSDPPFLKEKEYYEKNGIDLKLNTTVERVDWENRTVVTDHSEIIPYDHLVIATGSKLSEVELPGDGAAGIFYLRDFKDALKIKEWTKKINKITIIGAGFIGLELASTFTRLGKQVSVMVRSGKPLEKILGEQVSDYFIRLHESHGVEFLFNEETEAFLPDAEGRIAAIRTKSGKTIETEMVLVSVGVKPNLSFELDSLKTDHGMVTVNEFGETSLPNIYAGGDIVLWPYRDRMIHVEHWETAWSKGKSIARNILELHSHAYLTEPYFWTDQFDETFEYVGNTRKWDKTLIRGFRKDQKFAVAYLDEKSHPLAILFANHFLDRKLAESWLKRDQPMDQDRFQNAVDPAEI